MEAYEHLKSEHAIRKRDLPNFVTTLDLKKQKLDEMCKQSKSQMKGNHEFECPFCHLGSVPSLKQHSLAEFSGKQGQRSMKMAIKKSRPLVHSKGQLISE